MTGDRDLPPGPPSVEALAGVSTDVWAALLPSLRQALRAVPEADATPELRRLAAVPTSRLRSGRSRRSVERLVSAGGPVWVALRERLRRQPDLARSLVAQLAGAGPSPAPSAESARSSERDDRLRERVRTLQAERDEARRRADGEAARADREDRARREAETERDRVRARVAELEEQLARAATDRAAAVERERRRATTQQAGLEEELTRLRRALHQRERPRPRPAPPREPADRAPAPAAAPPGLVAGRPSTLPGRVRPGTTEAADLLLHRGRRVIVDGYNVTRQVREDLDLEGQRRWLLDRLSGAVAVRRIEPLVVFDGHATSGPGTAARRRGVQVRFSAEGVTADDEIVFDVEASEPDLPIVVVTDDRELRDRLRAAGVDLVDVRSFNGELG